MTIDELIQRLEVEEAATPSESTAKTLRAAIACAQWIKAQGLGLPFIIEDME